MIFGHNPNADAAPANGSFESGSFDGWRLEMARGYSASSPRQRAAGTATVVSKWGQDVGLSPLRAAIAGNKFAILGTLANGNFMGDRTYHISLSQELHLTAGEVVSGWAFFFNGDYEAQDSAWVKINDSEGEVLATPWRENSGCVPARDFNVAPFHVATPWTQWSWAAPSSGAYTLSFGVTTHDDDNYASYGAFDNVLTVPPNLPVPEPTTLSLVLIGAVLGARRLKKN